MGSCIFFGFFFGKKYYGNRKKEGGSRKFLGRKVLRVWEIVDVREIGFEGV